MPITVFDAVAKFTGDSSQLDQFIVKLEQGLSTASEKAAASTRALKAAQDEFRASIRAVSAEGGDTVDNLERLAQAEKQLALSAAAAKQEHAALKQQLLETKEASNVGAEAIGQLTGKLGQMFTVLMLAETFKSLTTGVQQSVLQLELLSEKTGIAINTLAGIEHVSKATGVSFEQVGIALTRLERAQALAIEGGKAQVTAFERIGIAANELKALSPEQLFYRVADALANAKSHAAESASAFQLLGRGGATLIPIFNQGGEALHKMVEEAAKASGVTDQAGKSAREWEAQTANLSEAFRAGLIPVMQATVPVIRGVETAGAEVVMVIRQLASAIGGLSVLAVDEAKGMGTVIADVWQHNWTKLASDAKSASQTTYDDLTAIGNSFKQNFQDSTEFIKHVWTDVNPLKPHIDDLSDLGKADKDLTAAAKAELEAQLANIEQWKAGTHLAYASGKIDAAAWKVAELEATDAAAIAHEDYLRKLIGIYMRAGDTEKAHAAQIALSAEQTKNAAKETDALAAAMEKHHTATKKVVDEYAKLVEAGVEKEFAKTQKAAETLTRAEEELAKAEAKLAEDRISQHFKDQEVAIAKLAAMHLITEQQKNDRLRLLEQQQADATIQILDDELKREEKLRDAAQAKLSAAKANPASTSSQLLELQAELTKENAAVVKAEDAKLQAQEKFNQQSLANDKSHYGRALLLAVGYGKEILAEQLKQNHAQLLAAQQELALAKARGTDTTAIQHKIAVLKQHEQVLEKEAQGNKKVIDAQLQLTKAQLLATQAVLLDAKARGMDTTAIEKQIAELKKLEAELNKTTKVTHGLATEMPNLKKQTQDAAAGMLSALQGAFEGIITGQQSFGKAMEEATFKMIGRLAQQWAEYFAAKGIADIFLDPPLGGAEIAASAALFALSGVMSGLASNAGQSGGSGGHPNQNPAGLNPTQASASGGGSQQTVSVPHLGDGGIVMKPTLIMAGDSGQGGAGEEAVVPFSDRHAMDRFATALLSTSTLRAASAAITAPAPASQNYSVSGYTPSPDHGPVSSNGKGSGADPWGTESSGGGGDVHLHMPNLRGVVSSESIKKVFGQANRMVKNRQLTVNATNSLRVTRRSQ